jgi:hypothetical protein
MKELQIKIVDFGDGSKVSAQLDFQKTDYDVNIVSRSKLVRSDTMDKVPKDVELADFPNEQNIHYMPSDPAAWAWLVGTWIVLRVGENLVDDAYAAAKRIIADLRQKYPKAEISVSEVSEETSQDAD